MDRISARQLYDGVHERMALRWVSGMRGESRVLEPGAAQARRPSLIGYLNVIYPNKVQILGTEELDWLDGLDSRQRWEVMHKIAAYQPLALVMTKDQRCRRTCAKPPRNPTRRCGSVPSAATNCSTTCNTTWRARWRAQVTLHGVFMEIYSIGVLITGESGSGKSELALELITRGHRLVADDAPEFTQIAPDVLDGTCPELLQDLLEVRGLGVLNVRQMFGDTAVKKNKYLRLIVHLTKPHARDGAGRRRLERLTGDIGAPRCSTWTCR